jgi:hypothetical protein
VRRWFSLFLLLVLMPLQFSWAAVAAYCLHEEGHGSRAGVVRQGQPQAAEHVAFHEHAHDLSADSAADEAPGDAGSQAGASMDVDCGHGHCHGHCTAIPPQHDRLPGRTMAASHGTPPDEHGGVHAPAQPERPQWPRLA